MRRAALILMMCITVLGATAQQGWMYGNGRAAILSDGEAVTGDYSSPTALALYIAPSEDSGTGVLIQGMGECGTFAFRDKQQYVVIDFGNFDRKKWAVVPVVSDGECNTFIFTRPKALIAKLKTCDTFCITVPIADQGAQTFIFRCEGYPLDW